ncbi:hypothetical protein FE391_24120 [Nonomuraea sp. KC401]|uniref:hypothetical protein n=1 Tax=unclassified Nonomuraea TaxID=2593643 RepID=UPI0010FEB957|nr:MULTISPECIES: hypothetical protein [unclassified Nonomuraea]NBE96849.1 hypothetical protein [Nonomuraea sp. K271]TLF66485.1 hypothetical protein FE391_24120 [Nonomuraea sp. KC401]
MILALLLVAGFIGAALPPGWSLTQLVSSSAVSERAVRRLGVLGPFGTAVAGALVNLGVPSTLDSARYELFGFALICAIVSSPRAANRSPRAAPVSARGRG